MFASPKITTYDKKETVTSRHSFECEDSFVAWIRNSGFKRIQVGVGLGSDVLAGERRKIKKLSDEQILDLLMYGSKIDAYEGSGYLFCWLNDPKWSYDESLYAGTA